MPGGNALKRRTRVPNGFDRAGCKFAKSVKIFPRERSDSKKRFFPQPVNPCPDNAPSQREANIVAKKAHACGLPPQAWVSVQRKDAAALTPPQDEAAASSRFARVLSLRLRRARPLADIY